MKKLHIKWFLLFISTIFILKCAKIDPITGEKVIIEPNVTKRQQAYMDKEGGIFGDFNKKNQSNTFEFATSNVLWRATLKSLDFLPLVNADYSGGVIIYDWYSDGKNSKEQIKVSVKFLNNELRSDSLEVSVHKKICDNENNCITQKVNNNFNKEIKDTIIASARSLKISEQKK